MTILSRCRLEFEHLFRIYIRLFEIATPNFEDFSRIFRTTLEHVFGRVRIVRLRFPYRHE